MRAHQDYFRHQILCFRVARIAVIVAAGLVPVLASVTTTPRWTLAALGGLAAAIEAIQSLFQFQKSALNAMQTANRMERTLNKYMTAIGPYAASNDQAFPRFVKDIEAIREDADKAFFHTWEAMPSISSIRNEVEGTK